MSALTYVLRLYMFTRRLGKLSIFHKNQLRIATLLKSFQSPGKPDKRLMSRLEYREKMVMDT